MSIAKTINKVTSTSPILPSTLLDLTRDTVSAASLEINRTAHNSEGEPITGELAIQNAEAYALGTRNGVPVGSDDIAYHNNSQYYAGVSGSIMRIAGQSALSAASSAVQSLDYARKSQSYATGDAVDDEGEPYRPGQDEDCSKYYYEQAKEVAEEAGLVDFVGATDTTDGTHGLMIQPKAGDQGKVITGNAKWTALNSLPEIQTINGSINEVKAQADKCECLVLTQASISALPVTISDTAIETDMVVINAVLSNPAAQTNDWTVNTYTAGQATISGTISGTTDLTLYLMKSR